MANVVCPWPFLDSLLPHTANSNQNQIPNTISSSAHITNCTNPCVENVEASNYQVNGIQNINSSPISYADSVRRQQSSQNNVAAFRRREPVVVVQQNGQNQGGEQQDQAGTSFRDRVRAEQPRHIDVSSLPAPVMEGDTPTVILSREVVNRGKMYCKFAQVGRLDFKKVSLVRLRVIASELWNPSGIWKLTPLGKGFFMLKLDSRDDYIRIWSQEWRIGDQSLHFSKWSPDFDIEKQTTSKALVWVQFSRLGQQYWDYEGLMTIGKGLGTPIGVDNKTIDREYGFFASVLVEIDLSKPIPSTVKVREEDGGIFARAVYIPKLPQFCMHCKSVGHNLYQCRGLIMNMDSNEQSHCQPSDTSGAAVSVGGDQDTNRAVARQGTGNNMEAMRHRRNVHNQRIGHWQQVGQRGRRNPSSENPQNLQNTSATIHVAASNATQNEVNADAQLGLCTVDRGEPVRVISEVTGEVEGVVPTGVRTAPESGAIQTHAPALVTGIEEASPSMVSTPVSAIGNETPPLVEQVDLIRGTMAKTLEEDATPTNQMTQGVSTSRNAATQVIA